MEQNYILTKQLKRRGYLGTPHKNTAVRMSAPLSAGISILTVLLMIYSGNGFVVLPRHGRGRESSR